MKNKLLMLSMVIALSACANQPGDDNVLDKEENHLKREEIINPEPKLKEDTIEEELENYKNIREEVLRDQLEEGVAVFKTLDGESLHSMEDSPQIYTTIDFESKGKFTGEYFATKDADGYDAGLSEVSGKAQLQEHHVSTYEGQFEYVEQIDQDKYRLRLKELNITSEPGIDSEIPQKVYVDFTKQINVGDEFIVYLDGAYIPLHERKGTALENQINPAVAPEGKEVVVDHAFGPIIYSPKEDVVWKTFVY